MDTTRKPLAECTDEELLKLIRSGQEEVTDYLLEKYKPLVRKKTNAMYLIGGENDDLIQEGMIGLFKAIRDYRDDKSSSFYHFAELCVSRQIYSALEASKRQKHIPLNSYISLSAQDGNDDVAAVLSGNQSPEQQVIEREYLTDFWKQLTGNLSKMENQVLNMYLDGHNYIQIAERLCKNPKSIDNALQRIRGKIRQMKEYA